MRLREPEMPLDPEIGRELSAIDAGLAGLEVDPELEALAELARETRSLREAPEPAFVSSLDEQLAEEFPREGRFARPRARIASAATRRVLLPAGAAATLLVAVGIGISQLGDGRGSTSLQAPGGGVEAVEPSAAGQAGSSVPLPGDGLAPARGARRIETNAQLTLAADPEQVSDVADGVVEVTHRYDGIVVSSQVTHGADGAHADFDLAIPSAQLQLAIADLSDLAHVQSSSEGTIDITGPTVRAHRRMATLETRLADLRGRLAAAIARDDTRAEGVIRQRIAYVQEALKRARKGSAELRNRADIARVSLAVTSDGAALGGGGWSLDDAAHDAGRVLAVTAGVLLVTAAVLGPVAVLAALAWAVARALIRWRRERSLETSRGASG